MSVGRGGGIAGRWAPVLVLAPVLAAGPAFAAAPGSGGPRVTVGSKAFPESWILGDALATLMRGSGDARVEHRSNLGGTEIIVQALRSGEIDVYPEYTGTISEVILHSTVRPTLEALRAALAAEGLGISDPLGFNDSYALGVSDAVARRDGLRTISDLAHHPELRVGLSHEFLGRKDGWPGLARAYGLHMREVHGIQHELAYGALASGAIDVTDIYTTDAEIERLHLHVLEDDRGFFPRYDAVFVYRLDLARRAPAAYAAIGRLAGKIDEARMIRANARVVLGRQPFTRSADSLLIEALGMAGAGAGGHRAVDAILKNTIQHLKLVGLSLVAAILIGVPLGVVAARAPRLAGTTLTLVGLLQTIPSLALLALLIPLLGIGVVPALVALFLYSLLPIVRNTFVGLVTIPPSLSEAAAALGLSPSALLLRVQLPMASPTIMAGIKTSAVINVGTATLAALIGAGGLGDPILSGIQLRQDSLILQGAVPAAFLALLVQWGFDTLDRVVIPRGLRLAAPRE